MERSVRQPNDLLRLARLAMASPSGSGRRMSRQELAEAVNAYLFGSGKRVAKLDDVYVGKLERGVHRWPRALYREAFRAVLGVSSDADLGFYIVRRSAGDAIATTHSSTVLSQLDRDPPATVLCTPEVRVTASCGAAVTVVCHDGEPSRVAVIAGAMRVLIEPLITAADSLAAPADLESASAGARVYSISNRRAGR